MSGDSRRMLSLPLYTFTHELDDGFISAESCWALLFLAAYVLGALIFCSLHSVVFGTRVGKRDIVGSFVGR